MATIYSKYYDIAFVFVLLALMTVQMILIAQLKSATMDEESHITRGAPRRPDPLHQDSQSAQRIYPRNQIIARTKDRT
ncbi:MAG: hypothetical protein ACREP8_16245 [Candidatus Binatia bacterium]